MLGVVSDVIFSVLGILVLGILAGPGEEDRVLEENTDVSVPITRAAKHLVECKQGWVVSIKYRM